jgi:hypothetical protein
MFVTPAVALSYIVPMARSVDSFVDLGVSRGIRHLYQD